MFSISLDAWTSANLIAFLAIVLHFVNENGELGMVFKSIHRLYMLTVLCAEEILIDFRELVGEHSGENMAEAVWETLVMFGIEGRVRMV